MPTLKSVKSLCHRGLHGAPLVPRTRRRPPSPSPEASSILVTELFHRDYSALFIRFVSQPRSPSLSPKPSSVHVFSSVLRPRLLNHSPSSSPPPSSVPSPLPSSILVSETVLHPCLRNRPSSSSPLPFSVLVFSRPVFWDITKKNVQKIVIFKLSCFFQDY